VIAVAILVGALAWRVADHGPPPSDIGGPFQLIDTSGARVDQRLLEGHWSAVYFGYTYCPDVCPTTLSALGAAIGQLGADSARLKVVFITVDPERDTPARLRDYLATPSFPKSMIGLTGSPSAIARAAAAWRVYYKRSGAGPDYSVDHTSVVYLMDPQARFVRPLDFARGPLDVARQIRQAMSGG
jgi:protein SCO1/2